MNGGFATEDAPLDRRDQNLHDASACLVQDGVLRVVVEEERLNRLKKTTKFPVNAIRHCLSEAGAELSDVDAVAFTFDEHFVDSFLNARHIEDPTLPVRYSRELIRERLREAFGTDVPEGSITYSAHHRAHGLSAFVHSGLDEALVVVMDGVGGLDSTTVYHGSGADLNTLSSYPAAKSLGLFYLACTKMLGYGFGDEFKVMGLAPYGDPSVYRQAFGRLHGLGAGGDYELRAHAAPQVFLAEGFRPRRRGEGFTQQHKDFAAGLQHTLQRIVLHILAHWRTTTGLRQLCLSGGVAHNCSMNGAVLRSGLFDHIFVDPASHDAGAAVGAAYGVHHPNSTTPPTTTPRTLQTASLGPSCGTDHDIETTLNTWSSVVDYEHCENIVDRTAQLLADGAVIGWVHGRSEFGPRALGNRSIIADPRPAKNRDRINAMIKKREGYRPFAPVVTAEAADTYFEIPPTTANLTFMSFALTVRNERRHELGAVTHIDGTARVQVVDHHSNQRFHQLVQRFGDLTGTPVLLNTSFNNNAEPIVQTVHDALTTFLTTELDHLVIENHLIQRRPPNPATLDTFLLQLPPTTRLTKSIGMTSAGERTVRHELNLGSPTSSHEVSPQLFALLERADGRTPIGELAAACGMSDETRAELFGMWQRRYFTLRPAPIPVREGSR
ncbi:carbamoyltransferase family protein [Wenjunlia tyrosinilytica]|uniref:carbamoyltransferase family protein n=1 Tax=Wenjunlia tyrosinilytica TaxID=1544741 RepID=UPI001E5DFF10|nr:carbamoyltransferase C-terminal domain-containing protein [Wenjunlia tyrosinilytica]